MSRKALIIVGLAVLIAASTGVAFATNNPGQGGKPVTATAAATYPSTEATEEEIIDDNDTVTEADIPVTEASSENFDDVKDGVMIDGHLVEPSSPIENLPESERFLNDIYTLQRVLDAESGEELSLQMVLGKYYNDCTISTYTDGTLELCLNPSADAIKKGIYSIYNDIIYVDYGDGHIEQYPIIYANNAVIESIIVSDGKYDYYFG